MVEKMVTSLKTGEPTEEEIESAAALKAVANVKPTSDFLEKQGADSGSDDETKSKPKRKSRNATPAGGPSINSSIAMGTNSILENKNDEVSHSAGTATPNVPRKSGGGGGGDGDLES
jgi:hypothetical protein